MRKVRKAATQSEEFVLHILLARRDTRIGQRSDREKEMCQPSDTAVIKAQSFAGNREKTGHRVVTYIYLYLGRHCDIF